VRSGSALLRAFGICGVSVVAAATASSAGAAGRIFTVAGSGEPQSGAFAGQNAPATSARLNRPLGLATLADGSVVVADSANECIRRIGRTGLIATIAGHCQPEQEGVGGVPEGDGGPALQARLVGPVALAPAPDGRLLFTQANRVSQITTDGRLETVAGSDKTDFSGDGGPAQAATFALPSDVEWLRDGGFLVVDSGHQRVRRVFPDGTINTVAGTGVAGFSGDGGPAIAAELKGPSSLALLPDGGFLIADSGNARVRRVSADGTITTIAGTGAPSRPGPSGDGGPALAARISVSDIAMTATGGYLFVDRNVHRVRYVDSGGVVHAAAGTARPGFSGDGGPATAAQLENPATVTAYSGGFLVSDTDNERVRFVEAPELSPPSGFIKLAAALFAPSRARVGKPVTIRFAATRRTRARLLLRCGKFRRDLGARAVGPSGGRFVITPKKRGSCRLAATFRASGQIATAARTLTVH
jgi:hypothetical protein